MFDEDLCATNFMIRDDVMRKLVKMEPITPLIERVAQLVEDILIEDSGTSNFTGGLFYLGRGWLF